MRTNRKNSRESEMRSVKRMDSPESQKFWEQLEKNDQEIAVWPEWKRETPVADPPLPRSPFEALEYSADDGVREPSSTTPDPSKHRLESELEDFQDKMCEIYRYLRGRWPDAWADVVATFGGPE